jgi:hypothetical protein
MKIDKTEELRVGIVVPTYTMGNVRIEELRDDEVHCEAVSKRGAIVLSRTAALRRIKTLKGAKNEQHRKSTRK